MCQVMAALPEGSSQGLTRPDGWIGALSVMPAPRSIVFVSLSILWYREKGGPDITAPWAWTTPMTSGKSAARVALTWSAGQVTRTVAAWASATVSSEQAFGSLAGAGVRSFGSAIAAATSGGGATRAGSIVSWRIEVQT